MNKRLWLVCLSLVCSCLVVQNSFAHLAGITDTSIQVGYSQVKVVYTLPTDSLLDLFPKEEVESPSKDQILQGVMAGFKVLNNEAECSNISAAQRPIKEVASTQFELLYECKALLDTLEIFYSLFIDRFDTHENFTRVSMAGNYVSLVFSKDKSFIEIPVKETVQQWDKQLTNEFIEDPNAVFKLEAQPNYFPLGIEHILLGFDHMLFLFALLLLPLTFKQLVAMVTSFTIAHSITLAMAVFDVVTLPATWVEAVIALSIVYVGLENLWELKGADKGQTMITPWRRRVAVTFCFGLIHGFGFSYVLKEIGLGDQVASALLFFNLGVEAGQLLAVIFVFPLLVWVFKRWPRMLFSKVCSVLVILMGSVWLVERVIAATN